MNVSHDQIKETLSSILSSIALPDSHKKFIPMSLLESIFLNFRDLLKSDPAVLNLSGPISIVGDLHGNFNDLTRIFDKLGYPPDTTYLFLGDLVDRGTSSIQIVTTIACLKILFPHKVYVIRGNHEFKELSTYYGFKQECVQKYGESFFDIACSFFDYLPVAAIINETTFCVHGGISKEIRGRYDIERLQKPVNGRMTPVLADLLWSDPSVDVDDFEPSPRGLGYKFSQKNAQDFMERCGFERVIRAHELCDLGFDMPFGNSVQIVTVFSSSDYCGQMNSGAALTFGDNGSLKVTYIHPLTPSSISKRRPTIPRFLMDTPSEANPWTSEDKEINIDLGLLVDV